MGDAGIVERLALSHERGHAVALAPRADDLHSRGARSGWSEGSGDSTAAYATRNGARAPHFWVMNDRLGDAVPGAACWQHATSMRPPRGLLWLFAAGCATSASLRAANKWRISEITSPQPLLVLAATVKSAPAISPLPSSSPPRRLLERRSRPVGSIGSVSCHSSPAPGRAAAR